MEHKAITQACSYLTAMHLAGFGLTQEEAAACLTMHAAQLEELDEKRQNLPQNLHMWSDVCESIVNYLQSLPSFGEIVEANATTPITSVLKRHLNSPTCTCLACQEGEFLISSQYSHPRLNGQYQEGRYKQLDVGVRRSYHGSTSEFLAIEVKYAKHKSVKRSDIYKDIKKLKKVKELHTNGIFILAGESAAVGKLAAEPFLLFNCDPADNHSHPCSHKGVEYYVQILAKHTCSRCPFSVLIYLIE